MLRPPFDVLQCAFLNVGHTPVPFSIRSEPFPIPPLVSWAETQRKTAEDERIPWECFCYTRGGHGYSCGAPQSWYNKHNVCVCVCVCVCVKWLLSILPSACNTYIHTQYFKWGMQHVHLCDFNVTKLIVLMIICFCRLAEWWVHISYCWMQLMKFWASQCLGWTS